MNATTENQDEIMGFLKSLADSDRLKIAGLVGVESLSAEQIAEKLGMTPEEVQSHLSELTAAGLVHQDGNLYKLDDQTLEKQTRQVLAKSRPPASEYEGNEFEVKTLRSYIAPDGTLNAIPSQQKKLIVILNHMAKDFQPGVKYPESLVNQILRRYHEDTAALRRYLVDNKLLNRERGIYWRVDT